MVENKAPQWTMRTIPNHVRNYLTFTTRNWDKDLCLDISQCEKLEVPKEAVEELKDDYMKFVKLTNELALGSPREFSRWDSEIHLLYFNFRQTAHLLIRKAIGKEVK